VKGRCLAYRLLGCAAPVSPSAPEVKRRGVGAEDPRIAKRPLAQHPRRERYVQAKGPPIIHDLCKVLFQEVENLSPAVLVHDDPIVAAIEYAVLIRIVESLRLQTAHDLLAHAGGWPKTISLT